MPLNISNIKIILLLLMTLFFTNCGGSGGGDNAGGEGGGGDDAAQYGITRDAVPLDYSQYGLPSLTNSEFNALTEENRYRVAIKLYASLFYGASFDEFNASVHSGLFISRTQEKFDNANDPAEITSVEALLPNYKSQGAGVDVIPSLTRLFHLSPGKAYLNRWAAYILTQTILFSPAYELNSVENTDISDVYNRLVNDMDLGYSMQWITFRHMVTEENWHRFRSPEDNGREMLEIFLMDFNDSHVPLAAKALQNWKLARGTNDLVITADENTEAITDLFPDITIYNGTDFYSALVLQSDFLKTITKRVVSLYFPNYTQQQRDSITNQIVLSNPTSLTGLLKQIIYSKEYLLYSNKTKTFEENFFYIAKTLDWKPHKNSFLILYYLQEKTHQPAMKYKLGRDIKPPLDSQSFAWMHKTMREYIMTNYEKNNSFESQDDGWNQKDSYRVLPSGIDSKEKVADYIVHTLFISIIGRDAYPLELQFFRDMIDESKYNATLFRNFKWITLIGNSDPENDLTERGDFAAMVLDYLSRLSTTYTFGNI